MVGAGPLPDNFFAPRRAHRGPPTKHHPRPVARDGTRITPEPEAEPRGGGYPCPLLLRTRKNAGCRARACAAQAPRGAGKGVKCEHLFPTTLLHSSTINTRLSMPTFSRRSQRTRYNFVCSICCIPRQVSIIRRILPRQNLSLSCISFRCVSASESARRASSLARSRSSNCFCFSQVLAVGYLAHTVQWPSFCCGPYGTALHAGSIVT